MEIALDPGTPIPAFPAGSKRGLALHTNVCPSPRCPDLHLRAAEIHDAGDERAKVAHEGALHFDLDFSTGQLAGRDDPASAWLASEQGAWLAPWVAENAALLRGRFDRLKGQAANEPADARPAPAWKPGGVVFHHQLYPHDFAPMFRHAGKPWLILDGCCPDPACTCTDTTLGFLRPDGGMIDVVGELGVRRPTKGDAQGKALWKAVHDEPELLDLLRDRRDEIRHAGPFIVGAAYEEARLARQASAAAAITAAQADDGYLQGGAIPEALVRRLFDVAERFHAARNAIEDAWPAVFRVEIRGAIDRDAWSDISSEPTTVALFAAPGDLEPWLDVALVQRDEVTLEMRRQRCALGLPLLGGTSLPLVDRWAPEMKLLPPSADDVRTMVAVLEALLAAPCEDVLDVADSGAPGVFEHHVDLDTGAVDVRLTASHAEHPWSAELLEESDDLDEGDLDDEDEDEGDLDDDDLDDEDEDDDELGARTLLEAFTDAAVDRGLARDVVRTARAIGAALARYAAAEGRSLFEDRTWAAFLTEHAPREVILDAGDIARAPAALRAFVDWLGEIGHVEPRRFRASLDRALPVFQQRARDPHRFGMAKAVFTEMRDAGVDLDDQAAIDRFLAAKNAAVDQMLRPSALIAPPAPSPAPATVTRSPTRWSPAPGERWPAPTDPCGCGSGRRFKKCCMAR